MQIVQVSSTCSAATNLSFCNVLVGASLSTNSSSIAPLDLVTQVDSLVANGYTLATTSGWSFNGHTFKVPATKACRMAFSSFICLNPQLLLTFGLNGTCGVNSSFGGTFTPCFSRCIQFQISCMGLGITAATGTCNTLAKSATPWNTPSDANCFCGDNFAFGASAYDACTGACDPNSECGFCPTIPSLNTCYLLVGTTLSSTNSNQTAFAQAFAMDDYISAGYTLATSPAGWPINGSILHVTASTACQVAFSSYFCLNPLLLQQFGLNGSCGVTSPTKFTPCLQRCINYQISCLNAPSVAAATATCTGSALVSTGWNTIANGNCFCGDNFPYGGNPYDICDGPCNPEAECGSCPSLTSMSICYVLIGTSLSTTSTTSYPLALALQLDSDMAAGYAKATTSHTGWALGAQTFSFPASPACRSAFASFMCISPALLKTYSLNGSCGTPNISFVPCRRAGVPCAQPARARCCGFARHSATRASPAAGRRLRQRRRGLLGAGPLGPAALPSDCASAVLTYRIRPGPLCHPCHLSADGGAVKGAPWAPSKPQSGGAESGRSGTLAPASPGASIAYAPRVLPPRQPRASLPVV